MEGRSTHLPGARQKAVGNNEISVWAALRLQRVIDYRRKHLVKEAALDLYWQAVERIRANAQERIRLREGHLIRLSQRARPGSSGFPISPIHTKLSPNEAPLVESSSLARPDVGVAGDFLGEKGNHPAGRKRKRARRAAHGFRRPTAQEHRLAKMKAKAPPSCGFECDSPSSVDISQHMGEVATLRLPTADSPDRKRNATPRRLHPKRRRLPDPSRGSETAVAAPLFHKPIAKVVRASHDSPHPAAKTKFPRLNPRFILR